METEQERLQKLYREMGDEHLEDMAQDADDLTDEARLVLEQELRRRGLHPVATHAQASDAGVRTGPIQPDVAPEREEGFGAGIPGMFPGGAAAMEQALEAPRSRPDGLTTLISFYDGMYLAQACEILEAEGIEPVIEPIAGDAMSGVPPRFEVWLNQEQIGRAQALLRLKMGLFPAAEVESEGGVDAEVMDGVVGTFESANEAEEARAMLANAGIEGTVSRLVDDESDAAMWELAVDPAEQERAIAVVAAGMGLN